MRVLALAAVVTCVCINAGHSAATTGAHTFRRAGVAITVPHEWRVTNEPLDYISDPIQRLVVSSNRVPIRCPQTYQPPGRTHRPWGEITFRQRGRDFYLFVVVGADAQIRPGRLLGLLDGLKVAKAP